MTIKGKVSADVTRVNVYCLRGSGTTVQATTVAPGVKVSGGTFHARVPVPGDVSSPQCRLRALPDGVSTQAAYLASYAGPVVNLDSWQSSATSYQLTASAGSVAVSASSVGSCSTEDLGTVAPDQTVPGVSGGCMLSLGQNAAGTRSAVMVDGHQAFPPSDATRLGLTPRSSVRATFHRTKNNTVRWTEAEALDRCATDVAFPPSASCTLKATGVEVRQVATLLKSGQVRLRVEFRSLDGRHHHLRVAYTSAITPLSAGELGVRFPGQKAFRAAKTGQKITGLGHGAGTMLGRTDRFGNEGDPTITTRALTWSRPPSRIQFSPSDETTFELGYRLTVPKGGAVHVGFADSIATRTTRARVLGKRAQKDMMPPPRITSPAAGSVVKGRLTKIAGVVTGGANGLPTSVTVNGHVAKLKVDRSGSRATYVVKLAEPLGKHTITVVAKDAAGIKRSASVKIRNK